VGVYFTLAGQFQTDLAVNVDAPNQFHKLAPNTRFTPILTINFHNRGPAWEPNGTFMLNVIGVPTLSFGGTAAPAPGPPLTNCQLTHNGLSHSVNCGLSDFAPGTSGQLRVVLEVTAPSSDYTDFTVALSWSIGAAAVTDLDPSNNARTVTFVLCGTKSTNPGCQTAS
jgi:hypothetical protein